MLVSVVTPSLNAGSFIRETIESVLSQDYPGIEYIVMDGGSTDGTLAILDTYKGRLSYSSAPDKGTVDAINRGFERANGGILAWLGADDRYLPGAVRTAVERLLAAPDAAVAYGQGYWIDETGTRIGRYPTVLPYSASMFRRECGLCQPACFMRRAAVEAVGRLDASLHSAFDYDLWIRLSRKYSFTTTPSYLAESRMHSRNKSLGQKRAMFEESMQLLQRHYDYVPLQWIYGYVSFLRAGTDQFYSPLRYSVGAYLRSVVVGSRCNSGHLLRYWRECLSAMSPGAVARHFPSRRS